MKKILVTGASGFIGQHLIQELLLDGYSIRAFVHHGSPWHARPQSIEAVAGDIRDESTMKTVAAGCDAIIHLAGKAHALDEVGADEREYQAINVDGTRHLLEGALASGVQCFIFASTVKVFGETAVGTVDERQLPAPLTAYARSKWAAEELVQAYSRKTGGRSVSLRLPMVYGPTEKGNLFRMIAAIDRGFFPPLPRIAAVRSMLHVNNFSLAVLRILQSQGPLRDCYIVTDAKPYNVTAIYDLLCAGLGKTAPRWRVPLWLLKAAAAVGDVLQLFAQRSVPLTRATLHKLIAPASYCTDAIIRDLNYRPQFFFEDAVPELIAFYRRAKT
jgi:nucleoside-diphosphate-sugar epimerase